MAKLRDYQRAILETLSDGNEHSREALVEVGARACSPEHALAMFQRHLRTASRGRTGGFVEGMSTEEKLLEIARQEVEGARMQAGKAVSHLEDRGYTETTQYVMRGKKRIRTAFKITDLGRKILEADKKGDYQAPLKEKTKPTFGNLTPEQLSERSKRAYQTRMARGSTPLGMGHLPPEERSRRARAANNALTPEQRAARARKGNLTRAQRSEVSRRANAKLTPEQRKERSIRSWETRRDRAELAEREEEKRNRELQRERRDEALHLLDEILHGGAKRADDLFKAIREWQKNDSDIDVIGE